MRNGAGVWVDFAPVTNTAVQKEKKKRKRKNNPNSVLKSTYIYFYVCQADTVRVGFFKSYKKSCRNGVTFYRAVQVLEITFPAFKIVGAVALQSAASCCSAPTEQSAHRPGHRDANLDRNVDIFFCVIFPPTRSRRKHAKNTPLPGNVAVFHGPSDCCGPGLPPGNVNQ